MILRDEGPHRRATWDGGVLLGASRTTYALFHRRCSRVRRAQPASARVLAAGVADWFRQGAGLTEACIPRRLSGTTEGVADHQRRRERNAAGERSASARVLVIGGAGRSAGAAREAHQPKAGLCAQALIFAADDGREGRIHYIRFLNPRQ
jgi:hypothetical protein